MTYRSDLKIDSQPVENFSQEGLKHQAESLRPFFFDENEARLLLNAKTIVPQLIDQY